ncbi:MAG TPA: PASTA domain-containing protein [Pyrinomonadaceae bacterium]|jgi:beta-lactam-binding protein with PASTA domain|nr:PASTA domain-containing protein [Pyrinomonadaceae bacterium]
MPKERRVIDKQTGESFVVETERNPDLIAAWVSIIYTLAVILFLSWLLLDTWSEEYPTWLVKLFPKGQLNYPIFKLVAYTAIGGAMGAAVNNIRSFVFWHAELNAFGRRFVWKYFSTPPLGAVLAVMVYAIIQGGTALISGNSPGGNAGPTTSLAAWVTGALAGYGSSKVLIWLDDKVNTLFKVEAKAVKVPVPDLSGKTKDEAEQILKDNHLVLGDVSEQQTSDLMKIDKVISQTPVPGTEAASGSSVVITIGKEMGQAPKVSVPDLTAKTQEEAVQTLTTGKLALGGVSTAPATEVQLIGKVITQSPLSGAEVAPDTKVGITIGKGIDSQAAKVTVPDLSGKTQDEAAQTLNASKLAVGDVSTEATNDVNLIGKVIRQTPGAGTETAPDSKVAITIGKASGA